MKTSGRDNNRDLKAEILATAENMFMEYGYDGATFQKISTELGITKGAITYHFKNKHFIILHIFDVFFSDVRNFIDKFPEDYKNQYWRSILMYIYTYRKIMGNTQIQRLFYHHEQMSHWQSGKVNTVYDIYKNISVDFHKSFTHEELLMTTYMDLGARARIYAEYVDNPELMSIDQFCHYHIYLIGLLARLDEFTIRENIHDAFEFANTHPHNIRLFSQ